MQYNTDFGKWNAVLKDHQAALLRKFITEYEYTWTRREKHKGVEDFEMSSAEAMAYLETMMGTGAISRATVINDLKLLKQMKFLKARETTGKGGHRAIYSLAMTPLELETMVAKEILGHLKEQFKDGWLQYACTNSY